MTIYDRDMTIYDRGITIYDYCDKSSCVEVTILDCVMINGVVTTYSG